MYLLDANAFIEASRLYYAFDIAPGFWRWLGDPSLDGFVASVGAVRDELATGTDALADWARARGPAFWLTDTAEVVSGMTRLAEWASDPAQQFYQQAQAEFLDSADLRLVAHALAIGGTVVTREQPAPESRKKIKIPDACDAFAVAWTDPFSLYRALGMRLVA